MSTARSNRNYRTAATIAAALALALSSGCERSSGSNSWKTDTPSAPTTTTPSTPSTSPPGPDTTPPRGPDKPTTSTLLDLDPCTPPGSDADVFFVGEAHGDNAGVGVAGAGDFDGDGRPDLLFGAYRNSEGGFDAGAAYVVSSGSSCTVSLADADLKIVAKDDMDQMGAQVSGAGDLNGDGFDDIIVGSPYATALQAQGEAYVVYGPTTGTIDVEDADAVLVGEDLANYAGSSVAGAGDVNGDGFDDLLVGATRDDAGGNAAGAVYVVYGPVEGTIDLADADAKLIGEQLNDSVGFSVAPAGNVNGDNYADIIVGTPFHDGSAGAAYIVYGPVEGTIDLAFADAKLTGQPQDYAGWSVAGAGDVNDDGFDDVVMGAPYSDAGGTYSGAVHVVYGPIEGDFDLADADATLVGEEAFDHVGLSVSSAGDVNGDGFDDVVVGAQPDDPLLGTTHPPAGDVAAYVVYGPMVGTIDLASADAKYESGSPNGQAGYEVAGVGDVDGDGFDDLLVGVPRYGEDADAAAGGSGDRPGGAMLIFGSP